MARSPLRNGNKFPNWYECRRIILFTWNYSCYRCRSIGTIRCSFEGTPLRNVRTTAFPNTISPITNLTQAKPFLGTGCNLRSIILDARDSEICSKKGEKRKERKKGKNLSANVIREIARVFEYRSLKTSFETMDRVDREDREASIMDESSAKLKWLMEERRGMGARVEETARRTKGLRGSSYACVHSPVDA